MSHLNPNPPPIFEPFGNYLVTPAKKEVEGYILRCLWNSSLGAVVAGDSRIGKTTLMEDIVESLISREGKTIPHHFFSASPKDKNTINALYRSLCVSADIHLTSNMKIEPMKNSLMGRFLDICKKHDSRHIVLIVDEGQYLTLKQCDVFVELQNDLRRQYRFLLTVIFVLNTNMADTMLHQVTMQEYRHIYGRFFRQVIKVHGIKTEAELNDCLQQYDDLRHPDENGPTYTEYFLPEDVNAGWRLAAYSKEIWSVFKNYKKNYHLQSWGMEDFTTTIAILLGDFLPNYGVEKMGADMIDQAIADSGMVASIVSPVNG